jgi:hypothetical protein
MTLVSADFYPAYLTLHAGMQGCLSVESVLCWLQQDDDHL